MKTSMLQTILYYIAVLVWVLMCLVWGVILFVSFAWVVYHIRKGRNLFVDEYNRLRLPGWIYLVDDSAKGNDEYDV